MTNTKTSIEWTDTTWSPVTGCTKVSAGCKNCYAEGVANRFWGDRKFTDVRTHPDRLDAPLRWRKPRRVFVNSMSDLFHEDVPIEFIDGVFAVMALAPQHTFQVLTKRPERMASYMRRLAGSPGCADQVSDAARSMGRSIVFLSWPMPNVWLGVSVEDQATADKRIPLLLQTPAAVRFLSCEPLLGPVNLRSIPSLRAPAGDWNQDALHRDHPHRVDWVIVGGESGPGARPCEVAWIRGIVKQCRDAGVACFVKQLGAKPMAQEPQKNRHGVAGSELQAAWRAAHGGWPIDLRDRKGGDPTEWPEDLRVRQFPGETHTP